MRSRYIDHGMLGCIEGKLGSGLGGESTNQII